MFMPPTVQQQPGQRPLMPPPTGGGFMGQGPAGPLSQMPVPPRPQQPMPLSGGNVAPPPQMAPPGAGAPPPGMGPRQLQGPGSLKRAPVQRQAFRRAV